MIPYCHTAGPPCQPRDVFFVLDATSSIGEQNYYVARSFISNLAKNLLTYHSIRVGLILYGSYALPMMNLGYDADAFISMMQSIDYLDLAPTNTDAGISRMTSEFIAK